MFMVNKDYHFFNVSPV